MKTLRKLKSQAQSAISYLFGSNTKNVSHGEIYFIIQACATNTRYISFNNLDISFEPDEGRGPVDFKVSRGVDKTIVEIKLSSNGQYLHGYQEQIQEYGKVENTYKLVYVFVDVGNPGRLETITTAHENNNAAGKKVPEFIVISALKREAASAFSAMSC